MWSIDAQPGGMNLRAHIAVVALLAGAGVHAQKAIWSHAVGIWRDGPVVYITPLIGTTEAVRTTELLQRYREEFKELREVRDLEVLRFATPEEGNDSRTALKAKYAVRKLEVVMLAASADTAR